MTKRDKHELRMMCKQGYTLKEIMKEVICARSTAIRYLKLFSPKGAAK